jgi:hypothetical protein
LSPEELIKIPNSLAIENTDRKKKKKKVRERNRVKLEKEGGEVNLSLGNVQSILGC